MQKYYTGSLIHLHKCGVGANPSAFPAGCELYPAKEVDAALATKDARIAELCQRLDQVHALANTRTRGAMSDIVDLTIGFGPAESHKVVE